MLQKLLLAGVKRPWVVAACLLVLTALAAMGVPKVQVDTGFDRLALGNGAGRQAYQRVTREFGSDNRTTIYVRDAADRDSERIDYPWGYGLGYNYGDGNQYGAWRIEVSPQRPSKLDNFLHVLHPSLKTNGTMNAELVESESGNIYGASVGSKTVIFSQRADTLTKGSYVLRGTGMMWQLLCNLQPEVNYQVKQDGKLLFTRMAIKQGTLVFENYLTNKSTNIDFAALLN